MTASDRPAEARREGFLDVAQREMIAFENREREFRRRVKQEELSRLGLANVPSGLH